MQWEIPFHIPLVPLYALRGALFDVSRTTPYRDLIKYPTVSLLNDEHLSTVEHFYNGLLSRYKVEAFHFGDFTLLPKKSPQVVVNAPPLSDLSVLWKLFSMVITKASQTRLVHHGRISCTQMAMQRSTSVVDLLRGVFDWVQQRWLIGLWAFMLLDDAIHAFGSVSHDTLRLVLLTAGVHLSLTELISYAVHHLIFHMGRRPGVRLFRAMYETSMGPG